MKPSQRIRQKLTKNYGRPMSGNDIDQIEKTIATIIDYLDECYEKSTQMETKNRS